MNKTEPNSSKLDVKELQQLLATQLLGVNDNVVYVPIVDSTNTLAMQLARQGSEEGLVVLTDSQVAGRGRQGRHWIDVSGCNVLSSTVLRPLFPPHLLIMVASLAVVNAITTVCNITATIKWPNDVLIGDRKVAGILIETSRHSTGQLIAILGIGVNVNGQISQLTANASTQYTTELSLNATTLETECGHVVHREMFIARLLQHLENNYLALQQEAQNPNAVDFGATSRLIREQWRNQLSTLGRSIQVRQNNTLLSGVAEDVNEHGELLLHCHSGERISITWGDILYPAE